MRVMKCALALTAAALIAIPVAAAVKAMTLQELMEGTTDAVHGKVIARDVVHLNHPFEGAVWTKLTIDGESIRSGDKGRYDVVFLGSHDKDDWYGVSTMPTLQDTRVGGEALVFFGQHPMTPGHNVAFNFAHTYRVERGFGEPVVIGKGEGSAFAENTRLGEATTRIRQTHSALAQAQKAPGLKK